MYEPPRMHNLTVVDNDGQCELRLDDTKLLFVKGFEIKKEPNSLPKTAMLTVNLRVHYPCPVCMKGENMDSETEKTLKITNSPEAEQSGDSYKRVENLSKAQKTKLPGALTYFLCIVVSVLTTMAMRGWLPKLW